MKSNGDILKVLADKQGIPFRTLADVRSALEQAKKRDADRGLASLMLRHGRLDDEAIEFIQRKYGQ